METRISLFKISHYSGYLKLMFCDDTVVTYLTSPKNDWRFLLSYAHYLHAAHVLLFRDTGAFLGCSWMSSNPTFRIVIPKNEFGFVENRLISRIEIDRVHVGLNQFYKNVQKINVLVRA